jgi:REP element-mobilizing transposase RayT
VLNLAFAIYKKLMFEDLYEESEFPLAYLLTFRTFGTWLHGDRRGSIARNGKVIPVAVKIDPNVPLREAMSNLAKETTVKLDEAQRKIVTEAIREVCDYRQYTLHASNARTNHVHAVISKAIKPEKIVNDLKAYSTRRLREKWQFAGGERVWSRGASTRHLWKAHHLNGAIDYVLYCQEDIPFEFKG